MSDAAKQELAELRAKREAVVLERAQRQADEETKSELATAQQALLDEEAINAAEREHTARRIGVVRTAVGVVVVKRPHVNTFRKFQDKGATDSAAQEALVRPCVVYPTWPEFERICGEQPATLQMVASAVIRLAGFRSEDLAGKS